MAATSGAWTSLPLVGDAAFFVEHAARIADGEVPHRDFHDVKPSGFAYLAAPLLRLGRVFGAPDWAVARLFSLLVVAAFAAAAYAALEMLQERAGKPQRAPRCALLAVLALTAWRALPELAMAGIEPKLAMLACWCAALGCLLAARPLAAGFFGALAPLMWQPAALGWLVLLVVARRGGTARPLARSFVLASVATGVVWIAHLLWTGSLQPFLEQVVFETTGTVGDEHRGGALRFGRILGSAWTIAGWELLVALPLLLLGLLRRDGGDGPLFLLLMLHAAWSLVDFQGLPDLLPMVVLALLLAGAEAGRRAGPRTVLAAGLLLPLFGLLPVRADSGVTLEEQREAAARIVAAVGSEARLFEIGDSWLSLLSGCHRVGGEVSGYALVERKGLEQPAALAAWVDARVAAADAVVLGRQLDPRLREALSQRLDSDPAWEVFELPGVRAPVSGAVHPTRAWVRRPD